MQATAKAHSNIALVKYWGKRANALSELNLPATGSFSMTLSALHTVTTVQFGASKHDTLILQGQEADRASTQKIHAFLEIVRSLSGITEPALVTSENNFPAASGLASSASAFAALALASCAASGLHLTNSQLSGLARQGSGSAARSIFGGFVEMLPGQKEDGSDAHAVQLFQPDHWDIRMLAVLTTDKAKSVSSRGAMDRTAKTSPYFPTWVAGIPQDLFEAKTAVANRDLTKLGPLIERNSLRMHASAMAADPPVLFWNGATVEILHKVTALRQQGLKGYFTMDAGPHVKVLCTPADAPALTEELLRMPGVLKIIENHPGPAASLILS